MKREPNGMAVVDRLLRAHGMIAADETWVHGMWTLDKWVACLRTKLSGKKLVRMTHGALSPVYLARRGRWRKRLVKPIERLLFALSDRVVATGPWEVAWAEAWGLRRSVEVVDLKPFFAFDAAGCAARLDAIAARRDGTPLKVLYLGRRHPLKGTDALERAVREVNAAEAASAARVLLREVHDHDGAALEADWSWCDVLCLPSLSENFGLVVAEALQRGIPAIATDGAPAWADQPGVLYLRGYRDGTDETRVRLLRDALVSIRDGGRPCASGS